ncbi:ankyrin repeat domain-containing protein [Candidatus Mesenet endosymbiont of Agriotes lineatus]|uniref:ankyrin repeat domain-containing protein n=1 Tax=Candidatus Mesenet endosymbiont of Agriotes lineatus TaxID=3077948 RepID=UPI0030CA760F
MSVNNTDLFTAIKQNSLDEVSKLLLRNIDNLNEYIDQRDINDENTPLIFAILERHFYMAKLLIYAGADVKKADGTHHKWTPLHFACAFYNYDLANLLVECGANVNAKESEGRTPLDIMFLGRIKQRMSANYKGELDDTNRITSLLLKHGGETRFYNQFESYVSYKKNDKCNINADAVFDLGIAGKSRNTITLAEKFNKKLINNDPTVKAAIELRNSILSIENTTMLYQDSKLINGSSYPEITDQSSNTPNIGIIGGIFGGIYALGVLVFLGRKLYDYYRSCNTYGWKNNRNIVTESLLKQGQDNLAFITLDGITIDPIGDNEVVATTSI